ncbi:DUF1206 domain-containing protein [Vallicoccus soli]|uniref:DUF1206 domain-containing protein n=1 Tax=Vallicoccus soli TaxID=2339232 RepID=A0A3A3YVS2_9ACTN|nr:DUF1206 domain-containing protein [Vallicoccus soli]RJK93158.1 DUF1206 domain-containing protein [Vallicoccus soli]
MRRGEAGDAVEALGKAVVYGVLAWTAARFATGGGSDSGRQSAEATATLLDAPFGRVLVVLVGLGVLAVGAYHVHKGLTRGFRDDLVGRVGRLVERLGVAGYVAKGVVLGVVGVLFGVAGVRGAPGEATGLDGALQALREQPYGTALLLVVAAGLVAYGAYSLARARYARL